MITIITSKNLIELHPESPITMTDIKAVQTKVDPLIEKFGTIQLLILAEGFKGWRGFKALRAHLHFVKTHHQKVTKIAMVSDFLWQQCLIQVAKMFLHPTIRIFSKNHSKIAKRWLAE